jgi:hypothetical protein
MEILKETNKPKMPKIKMNCDGAIDEKLEEQGEAVKVCFSRPNFTIFSGGMGSGKTTFLLSMLKGPLKKTHHEVFVVIPEISLHSISPRDNVFEKYLDDEHMFHELTPAVLETIYDKMTALANENCYSMLIIDDFGPLLKQKQITMWLEKFAAKMRHLKCGQLWILCQNYYQMPKKLREMNTNIIMFNTNKSQNLKMFKEQFSLSEDKFERLLKHCPTTHDWCILNNKYKRIFDNNWDEIVFT